MQGFLNVPSPSESLGHACDGFATGAGGRALAVAVVVAATGALVTAGAGDVGFSSSQAIKNIARATQDTALIVRVVFNMSASVSARTITGRNLSNGYRMQRAASTDFTESAQPT